jgi:hypothetical protein
VDVFWGIPNGVFPCPWRLTAYSGTPAGPGPGRTIPLPRPAELALQHPLRTGLMRLELMDEDEGVLLGVMRKLLIACYESEGGLAEVQVLAELLGDTKPRASARGPKQKEARAQNAPEKGNLPCGFGSCV